jgi:hypothetical protein
MAIAPEIIQERYKENMGYNRTGLNLDLISDFILNTDLLCLIH